MGKRIRYPKKEKSQELNFENKEEIKQEVKTEEKKHFVLEVQDSIISSISTLGGK